LNWQTIQRELMLLRHYLSSLFGIIKVVEKKLNSLAYKPLGIDIDAELLKDLTEAANRIRSTDKERALDFLYEELLRRGKEEFAGLSDIERTAKVLERNKGDNISTIPNAVEKDLINEYHKQDENRRDIKVRRYEKEKEREFGTKHDIPKSAGLLVPLADISKLHEVENTSELAKWIASLKDPRDRALAQLKFKAGPKTSVREIARTLCLSKSDVGRRMKKLKPPF
jgi:hypothetical protein